MTVIIEDKIEEIEDEKLINENNEANHNLIDVDKQNKSSLTLKDKIDQFNPQETIKIGNLKIKYDEFNETDGKLAFVPGKTNRVLYSHNIQRKNDRFNETM